MTIQDRTFQFSSAIIRFVAALPNKRLFWSLGDQLLRAGTSIGANIVEARAAPTKKDYLHYFTIALKSANETAYWIRLFEASNLEGVDAARLRPLTSESELICRILGKSIVTMKSK